MVKKLIAWSGSESRDSCVALHLEVGNQGNTTCWVFPGTCSAQRLYQQPGGSDEMHSYQFDIRVGRHNPEGRAAIQRDLDRLN